MGGLGGAACRNRTDDLLITTDDLLITRRTYSVTSPLYQRSCARGRPHTRGEIPHRYPRFRATSDGTAPAPHPARSQVDPQCLYRRPPIWSAVGVLWPRLERA